MKKISTLAVALITMGSLATSAWAQAVEFTPVSSIDASGWYQIRQVKGVNNKAITTEAPRYVFSAETANNYTWFGTADEPKTDATAFVWVDKTSSDYAIQSLNGQWGNSKGGKSNGGRAGFQIKVKDATQSTFTIGDYWDDWASFKGYMGGSAYNGNAAFQFSKVTPDQLSTYDIYEVIVQNGNATSTVKCSSAENKGLVNVFNGGHFFVTSGTDVKASDFTTSSLEGFSSSVNVNSTTKTISVTYANLEILKNLIISAKELLNKRGVGYPTTTSYDYGTLSSVISMAEDIEKVEDAADAYIALQEQMVTYSAAKNAIQMPEDGKVYRIYALWADGTKVYAVNDGKVTNSKFYTSGSKTEPQDNKGLWVVQKVGDGNYNIAGAVADRLFTYVQGANGNNNAITKICPSVGATMGQIKLGADEEKVHIAMNVDGSKMDQYTGGQSNSGTWCTEWVFEEVSNFDGQTVKFAASTDGKNYATLNLPYASKIPTGVTAYKVGSVVDSELNLETYKNEGEVLPVNTPVLLIANEDGVKSFAPAAYAAAEETGFAGTLAATAVNAEHTYILSKNGGDTVKFFALDSEGNTVNANKAYLVVSAGAAQALSFNFGNTATSIQNAAAEGISANAPLFDLSGRRVVKAVKGGIYIQNGKKFVK